MKSDVLKNLAMRAKNRLLNKNLRTTYSNASFKTIDSKDDAFYAKVKKVVSNEDSICNPIKFLMDDNLLLSLDERGKERYLLQTVENIDKLERN